MWNTQYMEDFNKKRTRTKTKSTPSETLRISYTHPKKVRTRLGNNRGHRSSNATLLRLVDSLVLLYYPIICLLDPLQKQGFSFSYVGLELFNMHFYWVKRMYKWQNKTFRQGQ